MADIELQIPAGNLNNARWDLDIHMIPSIFHKDPADFIIRCLRHKDGYLCAMFNRYYEIANSVFFFENPKRFEKSQFTLTKKVFGQRSQMLHLSLPDEHQGSLNYCTAYVITCEKSLFVIKNPKFFTIERHFGGVYRLGTVDKQGNHTDLGALSGELDADIITIAKASAELDARRAEQLRKEMKERKARKNAEKKLKK